MDRGQRRRAFHGLDKQTRLDGDDFPESTQPSREQKTMGSGAGSGHGSSEHV